MDSSVDLDNTLNQTNKYMTGPGQKINETNRGLISKLSKLPSNNNSNLLLK